MGGSTVDVVKQCLSLCLFFGGWGRLYSQYQWWSKEVCSSGYGGGERGCYIFLNMNVLHLISLHCTVHHIGKIDSQHCGFKVK